MSQKIYCYLGSLFKKNDWISLQSAIFGCFDLPYSYHILFYSVVNLKYSSPQSQGLSTIWQPLERGSVSLVPLKSSIPGQLPLFNLYWDLMLISAYSLQKDQGWWVSFHVVTAFVLLWKNVCWSYLPNFSLGCLPFCCWVVGVFQVLWIQNPLQINDLQVSLQLCVIWHLFIQELGNKQFREAFW
jgi:hypothetical protein